MGGPARLPALLRCSCLFSGAPVSAHPTGMTMPILSGSRLSLKTPLASWGKSRGSAASFLSDRIRCHQPQFPRPDSRARPRERRHGRPPGPAQLAIWLRVHLTRQPRGNRNHPTSMSTARLQTGNCSTSSRRSHGSSATPRGTIAESGAL